MKVTIWGSRGSLPTPGPETQRYGGNTACVEVRGEDGTILILDAGTGIRRLGWSLEAEDVEGRVDIMLSHLHMDHIQGLGFFAPIFTADVETHLWGPAHDADDLRLMLSRYLSPPLFPVVLRELPNLECHEVPRPTVRVGGLEIDMAHVCHPGETVGYRVREGDVSVAYLPDHEPALGSRSFPEEPEWTSGFDLAAGVDILIHDSQYTREEYPDHVGWGHSSIDHTIAFAELAEVRHLVAFHFDPSRADDDVDRVLAEALERLSPSFPVSPAVEGATFEL